MEFNNDIAAKLASKSASTLFGIVFKAVKKIRETVRRVKGNELQCQRLDERIELFLGIIKGRTLKETVSWPTKLALAHIIIFLEECNEFMEEFSEANFIKRMWNNKKYLEKFEDLHKTFTHRMEALHTSESLAKVFIDENEDQNRQQLLKLQNTKVNN